jgi:hypothetical protein
VPLLAGDTGGVGYVCQFIYDSGLDRWILANPAMTDAANLEGDINFNIDGECELRVRQSDTFRIPALTDDSVATITGVTNANPAVIATSAAHGFSGGDSIAISGVRNMALVNGQHTISVLTPTTFSIPVDTTNELAWVSGGTATKDRAPVAISAITQANPAVVTAAGHGLATSDYGQIVGVLGMTQVNQRTLQVTVLDSNTFSIPVDSTTYDAYIGGGSVNKAVGPDIFRNGATFLDSDNQREGFLPRARLAGNYDINVTGTAEGIDFAGSAYSADEVMGGIYGSVLDSQVFTANGTWTKPTTGIRATDTVLVVAWGGGGSGGVATNSGGANQAIATGGGGGGFVHRTFRAFQLGATEPVVVGAGGTAVSRNAAGNTSGNAGGFSQFGIFIQAFGGEGGLGTNSNGATIKGGEGGGINIDGKVLSTAAAVPGDWAGGTHDTVVNGLAVGVAGAQARGAMFAGGSGGASQLTGSGVATFGAGGVSVFGGNGGMGGQNPVTGPSTGLAGFAPGGGGGGAVTTAAFLATSGAGARGEVRVYVIRGYHPGKFNLT